MVRFDRLTPSAKRFLRAMAELGPTAHRTAHGELAFTVPLFDQFMRGAMPVLS